MVSGCCLRWKVKLTFFKLPAVFFIEVSSACVFTSVTSIYLFFSRTYYYSFLLFLLLVLQLWLLTLWLPGFSYKPGIKSIIKSICCFKKPYIKSWNRLNCRAMLNGKIAQLLPFKCITKTVGTRFQQHFQSNERTGVTVLLAVLPAQWIKDGRISPCGGVRKIFIALDQSHMFCELIVSLFCVSVRLSINVRMMGWLAPDADYWNRLSWAVVSGAED